MAPPQQSYRARNKKRQSRLQFSSLPSSSPNKKDYSNAVQDRLSRVTYAGARKVQSDVGSLPTPEPSSQPTAPRDDSSSPLSGLPPSPPPNAPKYDKEEERDEIITPASKRRKVIRTAEEHTNLSTPLRRSARFDYSSPTRPRSLVGDGSDDGLALSTEKPRPDPDIGSAESTDDDADILASRPTQRRRAAAKINETYFKSSSNRPTVARGDDKDGWVVDDDVVEYASSEGDDVVQPRRRQSVRSDSRRKAREQRELEDDLQDLQDSGMEDSARKRRTRGGPVNTQRDQAREHFDLLKRRRAGEKIPRVYDSEEDEASIDGQDINLIGQPSDEHGNDEPIELLGDDQDVQEAPAEEDDFIVDDLEEDLTQDSRPRSDVPLEFTRWMTAKPRELFVHLVEWLVKNKVAPAFARDDPIYRLALQRIRDQVEGQAGSRMISSAWNAEFVKTIRARPRISIQHMSGTDEEHIRCCDACNKSNRPARYDFSLTGDAYDTKSLEPIEQASDAEGDNNVEVDEKGYIIAFEHKHFYLGSHCAANAQMGHKLTHWKYHLNETVLEYLAEQGVLSDSQIVAREKKNKKQREKEAEAIVDAMEETGKIDELWTGFQDDLQDAMVGMEDYTSRGGRSHGKIGVIRSKGSNGRTREWNDDKYRERLTVSDSE